MRRTPHGVRELKLSVQMLLLIMLAGRTPHGVRELKLIINSLSYGRKLGRTPHGVRELKPTYLCVGIEARLSHPARGA